MISVDEVATGVLVNAVSAVGGWLGTAATSAAARSGRGRPAEDLAIARWFETYKLTEQVPPDSPPMSAEAAARLTELLRGDDVQAAVQELLSVRLTDGSNADAARAREAFVLTLSGANDPEISGYAAALADYYDDQISALVGRLGDSPMLAQIRSEALSGRMIAVLHAIERHTAALSARPSLRTETDFLTRYRAHVLDQHGKLEPPDFERRLRVPIADIYVPTVIYEENYPERMRLTPDSEPPSLTVWELADRLDRTVLLGDPGGGKTTVSTVLMHHFTSDASQRIPFLVTLRNYAAEELPSRSVVGFIENELSTLYQCPAPSGLVDLLLLTGRAVVIFDGLDELLDTSRRADVATRVEQFCIEYPLAPVLVTSRVIGYDQARLDETQFVSYRLGGFGDEDVAEYTRKWFALEDSARPDDADAFLTESETVSDLRANPLLLSLMCILYRGEGSLPRNRAEVYEQCANLLFRRWDARRRIHQELRAGHLVEPALRHLAWWLFTRDDSRTAVTERELVAATSEFLYGRGFESAGDANDAAREFVEFCRGRMWVFSDTGSTATGDPLYTFTHRTFLEYFAAAQLAYDSDTPEKLARTLAPHVARGEWEIVAELAVQIKDSTSTEGGRRVYEELLGERRRRSPQGRGNVLQFLARTMRSVDPSPQVTRRLTREVLDYMFSGDPASDVYALPVGWLMGSCSTTLSIVDEEITASIAEMVTSDNLATRLNGLRFAMWLDNGPRMSRGDAGPGLPYDSRLSRFWEDRASKNIHIYKEEIITAAAQHVDIRNSALRRSVITVEQALEVDADLLPLLSHQSAHIFSLIWSGYLPNMLANLMAHGASQGMGADMRAVGSYLTEHSDLPWAHGRVSPYRYFDYNKTLVRKASRLDQISYLGAAAILLMSLEGDSPYRMQTVDQEPSRLGPISGLYGYIERRLAGEPGPPLPDLPVPEEFRQVFRDWAEGKVNFVGPAPDSGDSGRQ
jgi:hypothetical protein